MAVWYHSRSFVYSQLAIHGRLCTLRSISVSLVLLDLFQISWAKITVMSEDKLELIVSIHPDADTFVESPQVVHTN